MTLEEESASLRIIAQCRDFNLRLAEQQALQGFRLDDVAIGSVETSFALGLSLRGEAHAAISWMRDVLDVMEDALAAKATVQ
ncbi:hypothetical protein [Sphingobium sp. BS19]|uniref:hypothetical protein n=1 Tax=Sphingobium sp. BS19 TaxID=3018973 RepID=UPI0022EF694E|nr:hypothetical protein [Sphingobium sp. BS19]GLJ00473.1 hypothetical protein Sbs19_42910 [Sphingobium sp. BS19]